VSAVPKYTVNVCPFPFFGALTDVTLMFGASLLYSPSAKQTFPATSVAHVSCHPQHDEDGEVRDDHDFLKTATIERVLETRQKHSQLLFSEADSI